MLKMLRNGIIKFMKIVILLIAAVSFANAGLVREVTPPIVQQSVVKVFKISKTPFKKAVKVTKKVLW